jgi:hypothetical protein
MIKKNLTQRHKGTKEEKRATLIQLLFLCELCVLVPLCEIFGGEG